jgi:hypothetical protein
MNYLAFSLNMRVLHSHLQITCMESSNQTCLRTTIGRSCIFLLISGVGIGEGVDGTYCWMLLQLACSLGGECCYMMV